MKSIHKTALVLLHYPVTNRAGELITTSVTNLDIHDLARSARTYEIDHYFLVTPILEQKELLERILSHWNRGRSFEWHPDRAEALSRVKCLPDFDAVKTDLIERYPGLPLEVAMPDARPIPGQKSYSEVRAAWNSEPFPGIKVIVLGTGWGIAEPFFKEVNTFLGPVYGPLGSEGYNHLSVRAAGAV
ncbi:MAG: hypothetical protein KGP28_08615, partial [Bdellovibrionales bacterium]|nr:hypothetical protein [Bdellovibrionales bacterium]